MIKLVNTDNGIRFTVETQGEADVIMRRSGGLTVIDTEEDETPQVEVETPEVETPQVQKRNKIQNN
jgi:hypothetical protein